MADDYLTGLLQQKGYKLFRLTADVTDYVDRKTMYRKGDHVVLDPRQRGPEDLVLAILDKRLVSAIRKDLPREAQVQGLVRMWVKGKD